MVRQERSRVALARLDDPFEEMGPRASSDAPIETIEFRRPAWLSGVEIMDVTNSRRLYRWFHQTYSLCSLLDIAQGGPDWTYRRKLHQSARNSLMLMEPGELHVTQNLRGVGGHFSVLMVSPEAMGEVAEGLGFGPTPHLARACVDDGDVVTKLARFHRSVQAGELVLEQQSRLVESLRIILERCGERRPPPAWGGDTRAMATVRDFLEVNYREEVRLEQLAGVAGVSPYHLCRRFADLVGLPPHAYLVQIRVSRARRLLAGGVRPAETAAAVGFSDQSHLNRHFRRIVGIPPGRYARMIRA